ncbi:MAG: hypothetical protein SVW77_01265 [Candidatus Nanohaloarchaea archaeon]|nr:hypothetical protein [Candidatus Nanohaloarchaea archaeon]
MGIIERFRQRSVLETALAAAVLVLTAVAYLVLVNARFSEQGGLATVSILLIILISVNILEAIIGLRILENVNT